MSYEDLKRKLGTKCLVALADVHTKKDAREMAMRLINSELVKIFFIEYQFSTKSDNPGVASNYGLSLNSAISEMLDENVSYEKALDILNRGRYFRSLNTNDSDPSIKELTAQAIGKGIQVVACDKDYADTQSELNDSGKGSLSLASPTAIEIRDRFASDVISNYLKIGTNVNKGRLMLWGAGHFEVNEAIGDFPDTRMQTLLYQKGITDVYIEKF